MKFCLVKKTREDRAPGRRFWVCGTSSQPWMEAYFMRRHVFAVLGVLDALPPPRMHAALRRGGMPGKPKAKQSQAARVRVVMWHNSSKERHSLSCFGSLSVSLSRFFAGVLPKKPSSRVRGPCILWVLEHASPRPVPTPFVPILRHVAYHAPRGVPDYARETRGKRARWTNQCLRCA